MAAAGKSAKKENKRYIPTKTSFTSPFTPKWSPLPQEDMHFILKTLKDNFVSIGLEKKEPKVFRPWRKKKKQESAQLAESDLPVNQEAERENTLKSGWTDVAARRQMAIGINEVTKALERNELKLLLVCKSIKPKHMADHLIALSATRDVPACQVPRLSQSVSEPLGLKSVLALGFRRCPSQEAGVFSDVVEAILPRVPPLDVAWLQDTTASVTPDENRGQKRRLETEPEEGTTSVCSTALQPLKVKKIVANSARKGRQKKKV
uniref:Ribonuclease P/MRP 38 subunit n=1 Tax=Tetraodon nigroviridis TaxID=99883 RepID=H3C112_TETNG